MTPVIVAPRDYSGPAAADIRLDGSTDMTVLARLITPDGAKVKVLAGAVNLNGGSSGDPSGGGYLRPGKGATLEGEVGTVFEARSSIVRLTLDKPGITLRQFAMEGRGHIQLYDQAGGALLEDVTVDQDDVAGNYDDWLAYAESTESWAKPNTYYDLKKNCTAAFLFYARKGTALKGVTLRRCTAARSYHHGFSMHVYSYQEGARFEDFLFEDCRAIACGSGLLSPRDWSTGFNTADTGDIQNVRLVRCVAFNCYQSGFHCDGNWSGHSQTVEGLVYERCGAFFCGTRCSPAEVERFCSGFYGQSGEYIECESEGCALAGFGIKNERATSLVIRGCRDTGSAYGLIVEYAAPGAKVEFTSTGATVRAFQGQVTGAGSLDLTVIDPPKVAVTLGRTQRIDYLQCPGHAAQVAGKYDKLGYSMSGPSITIRSPQKPTVEVWHASRLNGDWRYIAIEAGEEPPVVPPAPLPEAYILCEDGALKTVLPDGRVLMMVGGFMDREAREFFPHGSTWRRA